MNSIHPEFLEAQRLVRETSLGLTQLYESWWSGQRNDGKDAASEDQFHPDLAARRLFVREGFEVHTSGGRLLHIEPGDYVRIGEQRSVIKRWKTFSSEMFNWRQGLAPNSFPRSLSTIRAYIPSLVQPSSEIARMVGDVLDRNAIPFVLKFRRERGEFRDSIVVWFAVELVQHVNDLIQEVTRSSIRLLDPPPLVLRAGNVGYSESPESGESLGWMFATLIWNAISVPSAKPLLEVLRSQGIDPEHPWFLRSTSGEDWTIGLR